MAPKKRPQPLTRSLQLIEGERVTVARRTRARIALLLPQTEKSLDKATQTEIPMREVHGYLKLFCQRSSLGVSPVPSCTSTVLTV